MKHNNCSKFACGVPIWSEFRRLPQVFCSTHKVFYVDFWFYLFSLLKQEIWFTWTNRFYYPIWARLMESLGLYKRIDRRTLPHPIWKLRRYT